MDTTFIPKVVNLQVQGEEAFLNVDGRTRRGQVLARPQDLSEESTSFELPLIWLTASTGWDSALSDPSYEGQCLVFAAPHVGSYSPVLENMQSAAVWPKVVVARHMRKSCIEKIRDWCTVKNTWFIDGVDVRGLGVVARDEVEGREKLGLEVHVDHSHGAWVTESTDSSALKSFRRRATEASLLLSGDRPRVAFCDLGAKNHVGSLIPGAEMVEVTNFSRISASWAESFSGLFLSNGPGDPRHFKELISRLQSLPKDFPVFGICLGHQVLSMAAGAKVIAMERGHHGANHPVQDLETGKLFITTQNHGYAVESTDVPSNYQVWFQHHLDHSIEGFFDRERAWSGVQFHPEGSPGPICVQKQALSKFAEAMKFWHESGKCKAMGSALKNRERGGGTS